MTQMALKIKIVFLFMFFRWDNDGCFGGANSACNFNNVVDWAQSQGFDGQVVSQMSGDFAQDFMG